ncbi:sensor histidine kinase [Streptomyces aculeolatus]
MTTRPAVEPRTHRRRRRAPVLTMRFRLVAVAVLAITRLVGFVLLSAVPDWQRHVELRNDTRTGDLGGKASLPLFIGAQQERKVTAAYLADPSPSTALKKTLAQVRQKTDEGLASFRRLSGSDLEHEHRSKWEYVERIYAEAERLEEVRRQVDARQGPIAERTGYYTDLLATMIEFYQALSQMDDTALNLQTRPLVGLFWASEGLAQQDMLIAQARAEGRMSARLRVAFAEAYGTQEVMYRRWIAPSLPPDDKAAYRRITGSGAWQAKERIEQALISASASAPSGAVEDLPAELDEWDAAYGTVAQQIAELNAARTQGLLDAGYQRADEVRTGVMWKVGGSLAVAVLIGALIIGLVRTVIRRSRQVSAEALEVAEVRLPKVVEDLQHGHRADVSWLPAERGVRDEFDQLHNAVAVLASRAVDSARTVHEERRGVARFASGLAYRALAIIIGHSVPHLDELQRRYGNDDGAVQAIFELDHQVARIRRLQENVLILSDSDREFSLPDDTPVHIANVMINARGESDELERVKPEFGAACWIAGHAAGALTHLLAELIDNAVRFTQLEITVRTLPVTSGVAVEVEDRGGRMDPQRLQQLNARLRPAVFAELGDQQLGLFVVGKLADRLGVQVTLRESVYGGLTAVVLVPPTLLVPRPAAEDPQPHHDTEAPPATAPPAPTAPLRTADGLQMRLPRPAEPAAASPVGSAGDMAHELPRRVRGANLAEPLRRDIPAERPGRHGRRMRGRAPTDQRSPQEIAADFSAFNETDDFTPSPDGADHR